MVSKGQEGPARQRKLIDFAYSRDFGSGRQYFQILTSKAALVPQFRPTVGHDFGLKPDGHGGTQPAQSGASGLNPPPGIAPRRSWLVTP